MAATWILGLMLAFNYGWSEGWLHAKLFLVLLLSGYHGWLSGLRRSFARGERRIGEKALRLANEVPGIAIIAIVILVVVRSEEHTSELQSLMRISYAVFCLQK